MSLEALLHPIAPSRFFDEHWEKKPLAIAGEPGRFSHLFSSRDTARLLTYARPNPVDGMLLIKESRHRDDNWTGPDGSPDVERVQAAWRDGFTIVINKMDKLWDPVARFSASLEEDLHHPIGVNLYITPPGAQGFKPHFDVMDGFILQVEGAKVWRVRGPQLRLPLPDEHTPTPEDRLPPVLLEHRLESGSVLYIPRGFVHEAQTADAASVHLTLGVQVVTWLDLLSAALSASRVDDRLRRALPPRFLDAPSGMGELLRDLLAGLPERAALGGALAQLAERLLVQQPAPPADDLLAGEVELGAGAVLARRPGLICRVLEGPGYAVLQYSGGKLMGPAKIGPALRHVAEHRTLGVSSLPGLSEKEQIVLARRLVRSGVLVVQGPS